MKNQRKTEDKKAISLIVLVITIIVIIILATAVIVTLVQNNPIKNAKEAVNANDIKVAQESFIMWMSKRWIEYPDEAGSMYTGEVTKEESIVNVTKDDSKIATENMILASIDQNISLASENVSKKIKITLSDLGLDNLDKITINQNVITSVTKENVTIDKDNDSKNDDEKILNNDGLIGEISKIKTTENVNVSIEEQTYNLNVIVNNGDLVLDGVTEVSGATLSNKVYEFGDATNDTATSTSDMAKNTVVLKVKGDLTINEGVTLTSCKNANGYGGPKGLIIYCTGKLTNNGTISMTKRGAYAKGQNVYLWKNDEGNYEYVPAVGAGGGKETTAYRGAVAGNNGSDGTERKTGGGGSGSNGNENDYSHTSYVNRGGNGTSYSGGSGSGGYNGNITQSLAETATYYYATSEAGSDDGGAGGHGTGLKVLGTGNSNRIAGGGAGNPGGNGMFNASLTSSYKGEEGTGGLLVIYADNYENNAIIESNGSLGGPGDKYYGGGGSSGGGSINIFYFGKNTSTKLPKANGGSVRNSQVVSGAGGAGCVTIGNISTGSFVKD